MPFLAVELAKWRKRKVDPWTFLCPKQERIWPPKSGD